ncbi:MAG: hypothetical protein ACKOAU_15780 [Pirellula sp.]
MEAEVFPIVSSLIAADVAVLVSEPVRAEPEPAGGAGGGAGGRGGGAGARGGGLGPDSRWESVG